MRTRNVVLTNFAIST